MIPVYTTVRVNQGKKGTAVGKVLASNDADGTVTVKLDDTEAGPGDEVTVPADKVEVLR